MGNAECRRFEWNCGGVKGVRERQLRQTGAIQLMFQRWQGERARVARARMLGLGDEQIRATRSKSRDNGDGAEVRGATVA